MTQPQIELRIEDILRRPYHWVFVPDQESGMCMGYIEEFPGCATQGEDFMQAHYFLRDAAEAWLAVLLEENRDIPPPREESDDATGTG